MNAAASRGAIGAKTGLVLGIAGLIPFFVAGAALWAGSARLGVVAQLAPVALLAYGATIASFLGGVRWGVTISAADGPDARALVGSVAPQVAAWLLVVAPLALELRFGGLLILVAAQGAADLGASTLPAWYRQLRLPLTVGASAALASGAVWAMRLVAVR